MNTEHQLRQALSRKAPAPGFRDRVMEQLNERPAPRAAWRGWRAVAAGLALTATIGGWSAWKVEERRREGERAKEELVLALRIAGEKVRVAQDEVRTLSTDRRNTP
jgi:hypothetical protein